MTPRITVTMLAGAALVLLVACSTDRSGLSGDGGPDAVRDATGGGSGGANAATGGAPGGRDAGNGGNSTGGALGSGGGSTGGTVGTGGGDGTGGRSGTGGALQTGGRSGTGGALQTGGRSGTGGQGGVGGRSSTGGTSGSGGAGGGSGMCGGIAGLACPANMFCQHTAGMCDAPDASGTCTARPVVCAEIYAPVCGCDGHTYDNDCMRQGGGVSKRADGACNPQGCPQTAPTPGASCPIAALNCRYAFPNDPFCWRFYMCAQTLTWGQPQTACALASSGRE